MPLKPTPTISRVFDEAQVRAAINGVTYADCTTPTQLDEWNADKETAILVDGFDYDGITEWQVKLYPLTRKMYGEAKKTLKGQALEDEKRKLARIATSIGLIWWIANNG